MRGNLRKEGYKMKKIIAILLIAVTCLGALVSCGGGNNPVDAVGEMYRNSEPTKVVAKSTLTFGEKKLEANYTLTVGYIDGIKAAVYEATEDKMNEIEDGSGDQIIGPIGSVYTKLWYREDRGVCDATKTPVKWDSEAQSFVPAKGAVAINLSSRYVNDATYENNTLTFTVPAARTDEVFGGDLAVNADVSVTMIDDGAVVTYIKLSYTLPANGNNPETKTDIEVNYTYDLESITFQ